MNLTISAFNNIPNKNNTSFGMAKFSERGLTLAQSCSDIYECLGTPNQYQDPLFFKKKGIFSQAPFTTYIKKTLSPRNVSDEARAQVTQTILDCGTTQNSHTNAAFIKQFIASKKQIDKLDTQSKIAIAEAAEDLFKSNWNNPELSKAETNTLLEMAKDALDDSEYAVLVGVIEKSNL